MNKVFETVKSEATVNNSASEIWKKIIKFGGTEKFVPELIEKVIVDGQGVGAKRTIHLNGGGEILEELTFLDEGNMKMKYIILSTPMPLENYEAIHVLTHLSDSQCSVTFESNYEIDNNQKDEIGDIIKGFQTTFLSNLHR